MQESDTEMRGPDVLMPGSCRGSFQKVLQRGMVEEVRSERV